MKPTPQISHDQHASRSFPLTDYSFQPTVDAKASNSVISTATQSPPFHKLSSEFFGTEMSRDYVAEFSAFTVMTVISAWMILSSMIAAVRMLRNY
jgi:hypothetical protein